MSYCDLEFTGRMRGERFVHRCKVCGREILGKSKERGPKANCPDVVDLPRPACIPPTGVGAELAALLKEYGIKPRKSCGCEAMAARMNQWGTEGCREHRAEILEQLETGYDASSYLERAAAGASALLKGLPLTLDGILDLAIKRAEQKGHTRPPIRVAFLTPGMNLGGAERWVASLCAHFDTAKIHPAYVAVVNPKLLCPVVLSWLPKYTQVVSADLLPKVMGQVDYLLSWGCMDLPERVAGFADRVIDVQHGTTGFDSQRNYAAAAVKAGVRLTAVNEACLENFAEDVRPQVTVIQNGAEVERLKPTKPTIVDRPKTVLFIGRFDPVKNLDGLARAILYLPHDWHLVAVGPPYTMPREFPALEAEGRLTILPAADHLGNLFANADVFCAPSHHEAASLALTEAHLFGIPAVITAYPSAIRARAKHGDMAWIAPLHPRPQDLAATILEADKAGPYSERVLRAQQICRKEYTAAAMAERWTKYLLSLK